jgi:hypothetical protein
VSFIDTTQSQSRIGDELVRRETVMQFNNADLVTSLTVSETGILEAFISSGFRHTPANDFHRTVTLENSRVVGFEGLRYNFDSLVFQFVFVYKVFRGNDAASGPVLCRFN